VDSLYGDFATLFAAYRQIVAGFTLDEQRRLFHDNAARIYRLSARLSAP
jgi:predicted TIM-barrel fold metal-dependent hydrolase